MLYSILKKCEVTTPVGQKVGRISDLLVDTCKTPWAVEKIVLKTRTLGRKTFVLPIDQVEKVDKTKKNVSLVGYVELKPSPTLSKVDMMFLADLKKGNAVSEDDDNIGKIYNFEVSTITKPWTIEKVLIKTGTKNRRLRIAVDRVKSIGNNINVQLE